MIWSGLYLIAYIIYHILHLTFGITHPRFVPTDVYSNVVLGFSAWYVSVFYIGGMISLGLHLYHGVYSVFQTLGFNHPRTNAWRRTFAIASAVLISAGYISIPVAVMTGILRP
jgi:succinate dehydrogenase / fumarate reductase cytochrome b subunit